VTTHVLIVDINTFQYHLEYLFAATGSKEHRIDFNNSEKTSLHVTTENMLVSMMADASRIRAGDQIIFYLQQNIAKKVFAGKFFGIFRAEHDGSFLDNNDQEQFLKDTMGKSLTFRTLIKPEEVYSEGVPEREALDEIRHISSPNQMLWSLIYRKLKGNRGNTMITIYEAERLAGLIRTKNNFTDLKCQNKLLSFDLVKQQIVCYNKKSKSYAGRREEINIIPRLRSKYQAKQQFELHLQAYITKNVGLGENTSLDDALVGDADIEWLGNEVSCGVGMQRIDIVLSAIIKSRREIVCVEMKSREADKHNVNQIQIYIDWIDQYYIPNRPSHIQPVLLAKKVSNKNSHTYQELLDTFDKFNNANNCPRLKYVEFFFRPNSKEPYFETIDY